MSEAVDAREQKPLPVKKKKPDAGPEFLVSAAPHLADAATTQRIMFEVVLAMLPLFAVAIYMYRLNAVVLTIVTVAGCLVAEAVANWMRGRTQASLSDGSAIVTGMILAFSLPPGLHPYMAFIGGVVAIVLAKAVFGGLGQNLFNPAMVGRAFLMICFPAAMGVWLEPGTLHRIGDASIDGVTMATPLAAAADPDVGVPLLRQLFLGKVGGCVGETSALAALIGGVYLVIRRVADWRQPVAVLVTAFVFAFIAHWASPGMLDERLLERSGAENAGTLSIAFTGAVFHLNSGALMFGAFFIATDYVGAPITPIGRVIFGIGVGVFVMLIRLFGAYPEGVMFAILIMNSLTPLIERWTVPTPYGGKTTA